MTTPQPDALPDPSTLTYEQARSELLEVVKILELGQMNLDESLSYWERGEALAARCDELLAGAAERLAATESAAPEPPQPPAQ
ncbi:MAG: exodeoxyribonuclease VII small subunit [Corynebacterium sp.]|nr:exodeoxyribonuclease VII small subunit [Corynebacterium sp.]